jgi:hypothetical protein
MVVAIKNGVLKFKEDFGMLPPLVVDSPVSSTVPVGLAGGEGVIALWDTKNLYDPNTTLNGSTGPLDRRCYSVFSLPFYICGTGDEIFDGVDGPGFTAPSSSRDGSFSKKGRKHPPLVDATTLKTRAGIIRLSPPLQLSGGNMTVVSAPIPGNTPANQLARAPRVIYDRWTDGSGFSANDRAIRYYRWLPSFYTAAGGLDPAPSAAQVGQIHYWNIPAAVGGSADNVTVPSNIELKSAEWAIVSPGPDHLFGDEGGMFNPDAVKDNIVEVGR